MTARQTPSEVMDGYAARLSPEQMPKREDESHTEFALRMVRSEGYAASASVLRHHEQREGVVFTALPTEALERVRQAYAASENSQYTDQAGIDLVALRDAINDLLGLEA